MTTLAITVDFSNPDSEDRQTMEHSINEENTRRAALNPPGTPLPMSTASERNASYKTILAHGTADQHIHRINQAKLAAETVTPREVKVAYALASTSVQNQINTLLGL